MENTLNSRHITKKHFKNIYVFCKFNNDVNCKDILMGDIDIENLNDILKMFTLYESNMSLVYNTTLFSNIVILDSDFLKDSNYFDMNFLKRFWFYLFLIYHS